MDNRIRQTTVVEQVMERIKDLISSDDYSVGDTIPTEFELASTWGVSRPSIREAIKVFNYLGVLKSQAGRGTVICERSNISASTLSLLVLLGSDEKKEILEARNAIELWNALKLQSEYTAGSADAADTVNSLTEINDKMKNAKAGLVDLDIAFHEKIASYGHKDLFEDTFTVLKNFTFNLDTVMQSSSDEFNDLIEGHSAILKGIKDNSTQELTAAFLDHYSKTIERFY